MPASVNEICVFEMDFVDAQSLLSPATIGAAIGDCSYAEHDLLSVDAECQFA